MRIFKTKWLGRFAQRERITDASLSEAIARAARGLIDANLGGGIIKQRVARAGQGRSGGYRMLVAYRAGDRAVFLYGFAKNERENIDPDELLTLREIGAGWLAAGPQQIERALEEYALQEVIDEEKTKPSRLAKAMVETARDMRRVGVLSRAAQQKITLRHLGGRDKTPAAPLTGDQIRALRNEPI